jgi:Ser/Thr protein kinase RdoA (MazF antagonist)
VVECKCGQAGNHKYILQRINHNVFKNPAQVMENINSVTGYVRKKLAEKGLELNRRVLKVIKTQEQTDLYISTGGNHWRAYECIDGATSHETPTPELFEAAGEAFGYFAGILSDYPADTLHESIPDFHNTRKRFFMFREAVDNDAAGRCDTVRGEICFVLERGNEAGVLVDMLSTGQLPLRVTHNDTKLNNVLIDDITGEGLCVIDLDTIMPGLSLYDFGDAIRFGASTGAEDEADLARVSMSLDMFEAFTRGWLSRTRPILTDAELDMMPFAAKLITYECGLRFLMDYLMGDVYFKIDHPEHNLDRARTQFKLVSDMESKFDTMKEIVKKYA